MQSRHVFERQAAPPVASREGEDDGDLPFGGPAHHERLALTDHIGGNAGESAGMLMSIHARVVEEQVASFEDAERM